MPHNKEKKKIVIVITKDDVGGAQKYVADLASHLDRERFSVVVLHGGQELRWLSNNVRPWLLFVNDWLAVFELVRAFRKERPDVIHVNSSKAGVLGSFAAFLYKLLIRLNPTPYALRPKIVFTAHGWVFNPTNHLHPVKRFFYRLLHTFAARFEDAIINVSRLDHDLALRSHIAPPTKLTTIRNGIDYQNLTFLDKVSARKEILQKLEIGNWKLEIGKPWVGSLGRLVKEKDYETLIRAALEVQHAYFFIIGDGGQYQKLQSLIAHHQLQHRFFLVPPTGGDAHFLSALDVFVLSSIKEGLPYTLLEAMAAGLPIVITRAGGMPEAVRDGQEGFVVPLANAAMLARAINRLIDDPRLAARMGKAARARVARTFPLSLMIEKTTLIYQ